jgi:rSAM/selenodomain-associated transferase 2
MRNALFDAIDGGAEQAVLVGTDIPHLTADHLEDAFDALSRSDLVLGPSHDGGYWLVGLRRKVDIFQGIQWGGAYVLNQTLAVAQKHGLSVNCIQTLTDMDTEADLKAGLPLKEWQRPYLSVIIPTLNEERHIEAAIQSVRFAECEIIVADGGSVDQTRVIAKDLGAKVITAIRGRAEQQNAGAAAADGKVLLFLHADTLLPDDFGEQVFVTLMAHQVVAGAFQFKTDYDHWGMRLIEKIVRLRSTLFQMPYGDQALFLPKNTFEKVGGFPSVSIAEDLYLVRRLSKLGRIALAPGAVVASARRWRNIGILRVTLINYVIAIGCLVGIDPQKLAPLYRLWVKTSDNKAARP